MSNEETSLWFFGGYRAKFSDVNLWKSSANHQNKVNYITVYPYPDDASADGSSAVKHFHRITDLVDRLMDHEALSPPVKTILVGHSSGCAISNEIALQAYHKGAKNFRLICLDGYAPNPILYPLEIVQVWSAKCGKTISLNYAALKKAAGKYFHVYNAENCHRTWPLHFSLVNKSASDTLIKGIPDGYKHCVANLDWLDVLGSST